MANCTTVILWDCNGKIQASLFCSRPEAFKVEKVDDQMGMIAVKVSTTELFDESRDYLLRQVSKNGSVENQSVFGKTPRWAGGMLQAGRFMLATGAEASRLLEKFPARNFADHETRRHNGIECGGCNRCDDEKCSGK